MKLSTRLIGVVLAVVLAVSCLSVCAFAQSEIKSGIGFVTASALRLRSGPSTDTPTLFRKINKNIKVFFSFQEEKETFLESALCLLQQLYLLSLFHHVHKIYH